MEIWLKIISYKLEIIEQKLNQLKNFQLFKLKDKLEIINLINDIG